MKRRPALGLLIACIVWAALLIPALAAETVFPLASRIGLAPPPGLHTSTTFQGFEDRTNAVFVRLIALPGNAFSEIQKTMTDSALKQQGMVIEKRENFALPKAKGLLLIARQQANGVPIRKWLLIAPLGDITALVSFEIPDKAAPRYPAAAIRTALASLTVRTVVPTDEQLALLPFRLGELAGMRLVRVVPGVAVQLTDGPKDTIEADDQAHLLISIAPGGPQRTGDRDHFARTTLSNLPPMKDVRITNSESMRIGGHPGHEVRAEGKSPQNGAELRIVQWLRFGTNGYMRILGIAPKADWTETFMRFRAVRDGMNPK